MKSLSSSFIAFALTRALTLPLTRALTLALALVLVLPGVAEAAQITVKGSDTMVILGQRWAEEYGKKAPDVAIQVTGGGSGTGISALINGTTDICQASRAMKPAEKAKLRERHSSPGVEIKVAIDGLAVYLNAKNPIEELNMDQLKQIYTGKITRWSELGGPDEKIVLYSRESSSGTYVFFKEEVLKNADYSPRAQTLPGTAAVVNAVAREKWGIGYGGTAYGKGIKEIKIKKDAGSPGIAPSAATVKDGTYPLARPLFFYLRNAPSGATQSFIDWVLSPEGQALATKVGYFPLH
ncbi:MAG: phosphate ABC transporter substrate-binding protein [Deltaproteobacteria bacterium]|nr:phosphate ABC transporter substrate-binding protein [Deltaproteobacteria bacterium]